MIDGVLDMIESKDRVSTVGKNVIDIFFYISRMTKAPKYRTEITDIYARVINSGRFFVGDIMMDAALKMYVTFIDFIESGYISAY